MHVKHIPVSDIVIPKGRRPARKVRALRESIWLIGLLNPIVVAPIEGGKYELIAGHTRLLACRYEGWKRIPANVVKLDSVDNELALIDENLFRDDLTALERSEQIARRKVLYETKQGALRRGVAGARARSGKRDAGEIISFASDTAEKIGR